MPEVTDDPSSTWIPQPLAALAPSMGPSPNGPHLWDVSAVLKADAHRHLHRFSCPANEPVPGWRRVARAHDGANGRQWAAARIGRDAGPVATLRLRPGAVRCGCSDGTHTSWGPGRCPDPHDGVTDVLLLQIDQVSDPRIREYRSLPLPPA